MFKLIPNQLRVRPRIDREKDVSVIGVSRHRLKRRNVAVGLSLLLLMIILGSIGIVFSKSVSLMTAQVYKEQTVNQGAFDVSVLAHGWLQSDVYNLGLPSINASIQAIYVQLGQKVTKGQVLAQLDPSSLQQAYYVAQATVNGAEKNLSGALLHENDTLTSIGIRIEAAQDVVRAAQKVVEATHKSTDVNLVAAQVIVESDQDILDAVQKNHDALLKRAKDQLKRDLDACSPTPTPTSTPTSTPTPTPTPSSSSLSSTASINPTPGIRSYQSQDNQPLGGQFNPKHFHTIADCVRLAYATYNQTVSEANVALTTAQQQVVKDQQLINIACANGNLDNANAFFQYESALFQLITTNHNYDRTAAIALVETAEGQLEVAFAQLDVARQNLGNATLRAPHDGVVTAINGTIGGPPGYPVDIAAGSSAPYGIFIQLVDLSSVRQLLTRVKETDIPTIRVGQPVQFTLKAYNNRHFSGTVGAISPNGISDSSNGMEYPVIVDFDPNTIEGATLFPNMTANATITVLNDANTIRVPVGAIDTANIAQKNSGDPPFVSRQQADDALSQAQSMLTQLVRQHPDLISHKPFPSFVVGPTGLGKTYIVKPVVLGLSDGTNYEVLQGLSGGEQIMVGNNATAASGGASNASSTSAVTPTAQPVPTPTPVPVPTPTPTSALTPAATPAATPMGGNAGTTTR